MRNVNGMVLALPESKPRVYCPGLYKPCDKYSLYVVHKERDENDAVFVGCAEHAAMYAMRARWLNQVLTVDKSVPSQVKRLVDEFDTIADRQVDVCVQSVSLAAKEREAVPTLLIEFHLSGQYFDPRVIEVALRRNTWSSKWFGVCAVSTPDGRRQTLWRAFVHPTGSFVWTGFRSLAGFRLLVPAYGDRNGTISDLLDLESSLSKGGN